HHDDAVVEQRAADPQHPRFVELGRAGGPAELVVPVAPEHPAEHAYQRHVRDHVPEHCQCAAGHRDPPVACNEAVRLSTGTVTEYGSRPTDSCGGPSPAMRWASRKVAPASCSGTVASTASSAPAYGDS